MNDQDVKEILENHKRVEEIISQKLYYLSMKDSIKDWAKQYPKYREDENYFELFFETFRKVFNDQNLSRLQAYVLIGLISNFLYEEKLMTEDIDNFIDNALYSRINGEAPPSDNFNFSDDPPGLDPKNYARSIEWKFWKG